MSTPPTQEGRHLRVRTALGPDFMLLKSFTGTEELGRPFNYELELLSESNDVRPEELLGTRMTVSLELHPPDAEETLPPRVFHGFVTRFAQLGFEGALSRYSVTLSPWFSLLKLRSDCRIFQEKTVVEIIKQVFRDASFSDFNDEGLSATYPKLEYCVQYRETDFNFVSRLLEQNGIYYFFEHKDDVHIMRLVDHSAAHSPVKGYESVLFRSAGESGSQQERLFTWARSNQLVPGGYILRDFDFKKPKNDLTGTLKDPAHEIAGQEKFFDFPGEYVTRAEGDRLASIRLQEVQAPFELMTGGGNSRGLTVGSTFKLKDFPVDALNDNYLVIAATYQAGNDDFTSGSPPNTDFFGSITVGKASRTFRPARATPKPLVQGPQTAMVVGPKGEEIHTDEHGRVRVLFHWDRHGDPSTGETSCFIRVAQVWAGKKWGAMYIPRVGHEVVVEFLEGDPDRPIITGRVYNGEAKPPYDLPANKTVSTLKSLSSKGGGGFNELRFEDKKGSEQIFMHAEKDLELRTKNTRKEYVGYDRHLIVDHDKFEKVKNERHDIVEKHHYEEIQGERHLEVGKSEAKKVGASLDLTVGGNVTETFQANHTEETTGTLKISAMNITIEAMASLTIKCGGASIQLSPAGITVNAAATYSLTAGNASASAGIYSFNAGMATFSGVVQSATLITNAVVSSAYTPGAGNIL